MSITQAQVKDCTSDTLNRTFVLVLLTHCTKMLLTTELAVDNRDEEVKGLRGRLNRLRNRQQLGQKQRQQQWLDTCTMNDDMMLFHTTTTTLMKGDTNIDYDIDRSSTARTSSSSIFQNAIDEVTNEISGREEEVDTKLENKAASKGKGKIEKSIRWGVVQLRIYEIVLSDNPSVTSGPPIGLGWRYNNCFTINELKQYQRSSTGSSSTHSHSDESHHSCNSNTTGDTPHRRSSSAINNSSACCDDTNEPISVDVYENIRSNQRHMFIEDLIIPTWEREQCLMEYNNFNRTELNKVITNITEIKLSRQSNSKLGFFEKGGFTSLLQKRLQKKHKLHSNYF